MPYRAVLEFAVFADNDPLAIRFDFASPAEDIDQTRGEIAPKRGAERLGVAPAPRGAAEEQLPLAPAVVAVGSTQAAGRTAANGPVSISPREGWAR